ncbi:MAG: VIT1/CCC1 transporter family protein, partial [Methanobacterium sp.]|nr:VIT1/CCC1 transporter family protein [Methanobacterium sp.]
RHIYMSMFTHGFSSFIGSFVPVTAVLLIADRITATIVTLIMCFVALIFLGIYLGKVSRKSLFKTSIEIVVIGIFIMVVSFVIGGG